MEQQAQTLLEFSSPYLVVIIAGVIGLWLKEVIADVVASIRWKMKPGFEPGDLVFLDNEKATIVSIGMRETIFEIKNDKGRVWRYVNNTRIPYVKLEKIVE